MELIGNTPSPLTRIVRFMSAEAAVEGRLVPARVSSRNPHSDLVHLNPASRTPTGLLPNGSALFFDSRAVCRWIAAQLGARADFYPIGAVEWKVLRHEAMAHGILDAAVLVHYEGHLRPQGQTLA